MVRLNKCHFIGGLVGVLLGIIGTLGVQAIINNNAFSTSDKISNFDIIDPDSSGDVLITRYGKKYHNEWCSAIKLKQTQRVNSADAEDVGLTPCKKCH